jgi:Peptidase C13 family
MKKLSLLLAFLFVFSTQVFAQQVHYLGVAASDSEDVFISEVTRGAQVVATRYKVASSQVVGQSFFKTVSVQSIRSSILESAQKMDKSKDIFFIFLTSHAGKDVGLALIKNRQTTYLTPTALRDFLQEADIKYSVIVVSSCFSGQFVKPLSSPNHIVITAARADRTSFGCDNGRDYTYFGEAFYGHGLTKTNDIRQAFALSKTYVTGLEKPKGFTPSLPQASFGASALKQLHLARQ